jgi:hypothetical protein
VLVTPLSLLVAAVFDRKAMAEDLQKVKLKKQRKAVV